MQIPWIGPLFDRRDDLRVRALRDQLGRGGRIVSWHRDNPRNGSPWTARVSCRDHPETVEARGRTRRRAILAAADALARRINGRPGPPPDLE